MTLCKTLPLLSFDTFCVGDCDLCVLLDAAASGVLLDVPLLLLLLLSVTTGRLRKKDPFNKESSSSSSSLLRQ